MVRVRRQADHENLKDKNSALAFMALGGYLADSAYCPLKGLESGHHIIIGILINMQVQGAQWLSGRVLDLRPKGCGFEPHRHHCVVSLSKNINPSLVLVQPRKTRLYITDS